MLARAAHPERCAVNALARWCQTAGVHLRGSSDRAIADRGRRRSLASVSTCMRLHTAWTDDATTLGP